MKNIYVLFTMDVEPVELPDHPPTSIGPEDIDESEGSIQSFFSLCIKHGYPATFFIHPEMTKAQKDSFLRLQDKGACLGLHLHPWKFLKKLKRVHLGEMSYKEQKEILSTATEIWSKNLMQHPLYFRPGSYSANDFTFGVLEELGFVGGSVSLPGRFFPDIKANWVGAPLDPHQAHECFRHVSGNLKFVNVPLSVDSSSLDKQGNRIYHKDIRPEWESANYNILVNKIINQLIDRGPKVPVIQVVTHNNINFFDKNNRVAHNLIATIQNIKKTCNDKGVEPVGATIETICNIINNNNINCITD